MDATITLSEAQFHLEIPACLQRVQPSFTLRDTSHNKSVPPGYYDHFVRSIISPWSTMYSFPHSLHHDLTSPLGPRIRRLNSLPSSTRPSSPGWMMPHLEAIERAVLMLSPVTMRTKIPACLQLRMASGTCGTGRKSSAKKGLKLKLENFTRSVVLSSDKNLSSNKSLLRRMKETTEFN